ncbi:MAG: hypothetical protein K0S79_509 [Nitrospira sp.]|jgi:hypothetical protein|nr:hypothetical protein [Nitrospira sp.]
MAHIRTCWEQEEKCDSEEMSPTRCDCAIPVPTRYAIHRSTLIRDRDGAIKKPSWGFDAESPSIVCAPTVTQRYAYLQSEGLSSFCRPRGREL